MTCPNMEHTLKKVVVYLKFKFIWVFCVFICDIWQPHTDFELIRLSVVGN